MASGFIWCVSREARARYLRPSSYILESLVNTSDESLELPFDPPIMSRLSFLKSPNIPGLMFIPISAPTISRVNRPTLSASGIFTMSSKLLRGVWASCSGAIVALNSVSRAIISIGSCIYRVFISPWTTSAMRRLA